MRGKLPSLCICADIARITPAHAGKTGKYLSPVCSRADHPRACGENIQILSLTSRNFGSPPRMRGKHRRGVDIRVRPRITPAHAGKTNLKKILVLWLTDHPRACGENIFVEQQRQPLIGSPPRMRGKLLRPDTPVREPRITPAHAGKTAHRGRTFLSRSDHPRACGENLLPFITFRDILGSPPRMRGKPPRVGRCLPAPRITPAHAGKTHPDG